MSIETIIFGWDLGRWRQCTLQSSFQSLLYIVINLILPQSLLSNRVTSISCKTNDRIWVSSNSGLTLLDRANNQFTHYINDQKVCKVQNNNDIVFLQHDRDGVCLWGVWGVGLRL